MYPVKYITVLYYRTKKKNFRAIKFSPYLLLNSKLS